MTTPSDNTMRTAIRDRDTAFDGHFYYGVITTGVFCNPSCAARPARPENLRFFAGSGEAMAAGFRPCKRCKPVSGNDATGKLVAAARYLEAHADERVTLANLAATAGLSASRFQRNFKSAFGISPKAYQDALRMQRFRGELKVGSNVTDAVYAAGYSSTSRVFEARSHNIGMSPSAYRAGGAGETISYACRKTVLGPVMMAATDRGVCFVEFGQDRTSLRAQLQQEFPAATLTATTASTQLQDWLEALDAHLSQRAPRPDLPLDLRGTAFQVSVWRFLLGVREGDVLSYGELAAGIGKPAASRAVAAACAANRIGVLVPCHRVLRGNGELGGYRWGVERKRALLDAERRS